MRMPLRVRITVCIVGVLIIALINGALGVYWGYQYRKDVEAIAVENLASVRAAEELEIALLEQRGYVLSYVLDDGSGSWLEQLARRQRSFANWMTNAHATAHTERERHILRDLEVSYAAYSAKRDEIVARFRDGDMQAVKAGLLRELPILDKHTYDHCEAFIDVNNLLADETTAKARRTTGFQSLLMVATSLASLVLGGALLWMFLRRVIRPLRTMAVELHGSSGAITGRDADHEILDHVGRYWRTLMNDVAEVRVALAISNKRLQQAEQLATVGRLAASVAHEIRNPLTAIKMWLYSLRRDSGAPPDTRRQFDAINDEIARLESIVTSFLEFSRPPDLKVGEVNIGDMLDRTRELLAARLAGNRIELIVRTESNLPAIFGDATQLRQVLINLLNNATDAMPAGGRILVTASRGERNGTPYVVLRVADSGGGLPEGARQRLFEPFFSTKEHGTGLGLSIGASIMARHRGLLRLERTTTEGTEFAMWIPTALVDSSAASESGRTTA